MGSFWREPQGFGGTSFHINLNLLAAAVGDDPDDSLRGSASLVSTEPYDVDDTLTVDVQPWAARVRLRGGGSLLGPLAIGPALAEFLDDPVGLGQSLGLGLPFFDDEVSISNGWLRPPKKKKNGKTDFGSAFHGGCDFSIQRGEPRPLIEVAAAADGVVQAAGGPVVLEHEPAPGKRYRTIYQHLDRSTLTWSRGDFVRRGQKIGRIARQFSAGGSDFSHLHFAVGVKRRGFDLGSDPVPDLWYVIDPFGVYNYHEPDADSDYVYVPRRPGGLHKKIRGAERTIHWATNPPILSLPGEIHTGYHSIREMQTRARSRKDHEIDQVLIWLRSVDHFFFVALDRALDRPIEREMITTLRKAHATGRKVKLGYRSVGGERQVSAAWIQR